MAAQTTTWPPEIVTCHYGNGNMAAQTTWPTEIVTCHYGNGNMAV
jgi:hypothetical protein